MPANEVADRQNLMGQALRFIYDTVTMKNHVIGRQVIETKPQMKKTVLSHRKRIQKSPSLICSFFQTQTTRYAA
jgi:hypothetical protein